MLHAGCTTDNMPTAYIVTNNSNGCCCSSVRTTMLVKRRSEEHCGSHRRPYSHLAKLLTVQLFIVGAHDLTDLYIHSFQACKRIVFLSKRP